MLTQLFRGQGDFKDTLILLLFRVVVLMIAFPVHELAHGYTAYKLGDPTARNFGRLTLNPVKHLDPIGVLLLLFVGFGWAKPVPVNPRYFKKPKRDIALTSVAGPASNMILALFGVIVYRVILACALGFFSGYGGGYGSSAVFISFILDFFNTFVVINLSLAFFNLIPIPPLDGSKILDAALPAKASWYYNQISRFGFLILIVLINTPILNYPLSFLVSRTYMLFHNAIGLIPFL